MHPACRSPRTTYACAALAGALVVACTGAQTPGGAGSDQRSTAEYDVANDAFHHQKLREALEHVEAALKLNEENADAAYLGACVLLQFCEHDERSSDCRYPDAERFAKKAIDAAPEHRDAKNALGLVLIHEKKYDEAIAILKPLANDILYKTPEKAWGNLGLAYLERGNNDEAIDALRRAIAAEPRYCAGKFHLGKAFENKQEYVPAREAFTQAVETDAPDCNRLQDAFEGRCRVDEKLSLRAEAKEDCTKCRDLAPKTESGQRCASKLQTYP